MSAGTCANPLCEKLEVRYAGLWCSIECHQEDSYIAQKRGLIARRHIDHPTAPGPDPIKPRRKYADPLHWDGTMLTVHGTPEGSSFIDHGTGDRCTSAFMDIVVTHFVREKRTTEQIARTYKIREGFVRAILTFNRIPLTMTVPTRRPARSTS